MRNLWKTFIAIGLILAILQAPHLNDAKLIKKGLKVLKKYKKYAYLLASKKNKLYAVPFPMPLPVFVKRQHIYTQVPIIPRYVQHPQPYGTPALSADSPASYELMSSSYMPEVRVPSTDAGGGSSPARKKPSSDSTKELQQQYLGSSGKYLAQIAGILAQANPNGVMSANKDLLSKLLSGQARVLPPTSLISAIKNSSGAAMAGGSKQTAGSEQEPEQPERGQKSASAGGHSSGSSGSVNYDDPTNSTKSDSSSETKEAASELYKSTRAYKRPLYGAMYANPYASMMAPMMSPFAAMAMANRVPAAYERAPLPTAPLASYGLPVGDAYDSINQIDSQQEPQEMAASSPQDHESFAAGRDYPNAYQNLLRQQQLQLQLRSQVAPNPMAAALQRLQGLQMAARQREALRAALMREHEVAARLAESRQILVRAHQLGLPLLDDQAGLQKYYGRQQQPRQQVA